MFFAELGNDITNFFEMQFAENYAKKGTVRLKEIFTPGTLQVPKSHNQLKELESVHKVTLPFVSPVQILSIDTTCNLSVNSQYYCILSRSSEHKFLCSLCLS